MISLFEHEVPEIRAVLEDAGGIVQPFAFDAERFEVYAQTFTRSGS